MRTYPLFLAFCLIPLFVACEWETYKTGSDGHWEFPDASIPDADDGDVQSDACVPSEEVCDGLDNDCDQVVDNGFNLQSDPTNCGTCGNVCSFDYATSSCIGGQCVMGDCFPGHFNVNGDENDGCEYNCFVSNDGTELCDGKDNNCNGQIDEDFDLQNDPLNCGSCSNTCVFLNGVGGCSGGHCVIAGCVGGFRDADNDPNNGCECKMALTEGTTICTEGMSGQCGTDEVCADADGDGTAHCAPVPLEICDGKDNDCNGLTDAEDTMASDARLGLSCFGDPDGLCATAAHEGTTSCVNGAVVCSGANLLYANSVAETCNGIDDDCDGVIDDNTTDSGASCGTSAIFPCSIGTVLCVNGSLECVGAVEPSGAEVCNGVDDDCNGTVDDNPTDAGAACNVPSPPPAGATSPCQAGTLQCIGGALQCSGSILPTGDDTCGVDGNCNGILENQPDLTSDVQNCGTCNNNCNSLGANANWSCAAGTCQFNGCKTGYHDLDGDQSCEYPCIFNSSTETCNGIDDNCDGEIDEGVTPPSLNNLCGISLAATRPECTTLVSAQCVGGTWQCSFPAGVCNPTCAAAVEICDTLDNNCNGSLNENVPQYGKDCYSDEGLPYPGHGACRTAGTYVCSGNDAVVCDAVKGSCEPNCDEDCDGIDNDCDGLVDETYETNVGDAYFIRPDVVQIGTNLWMTAYEISRPTASATSFGIGNGYHCGSGCSPLPSAPAGVTLDETIGCSVQGHLPWFNVSPIEVEQVCDAIGGRICTLSEWQGACQAGAGCNWGYNPNNAQCQSVASSTKYCNTGYFDFVPGVWDSTMADDQDGLLVCGSPLLMNCWADWADPIYDITGNLREITKAASYDYRLMGGSFATSSEAGASCTFDFYSVEEDFQGYDTGFRCCFDTDPR
ncbi:hypothetical protein KKF84_02755 [Myxococcota bacterium]|nr:hypothetical protein [Myxococcota bacterium]MBU1534210.1 hypothetical protein [Myxococcota bacterium]